MGQFQLCAMEYAMVSNNQSREKTESVAKLNFDNGRMQVIRQPHVIRLPALIFFLLFFLLPGHAITESGSITGFSQFHNSQAYNSGGAAPNVSLDSHLYVSPIHRIYYTGFTRISVIIDSSNREES